MKFGTTDRRWYSRVFARPHGKEMRKKIYMDKENFHKRVNWGIDDGERVGF